MAFLFVSELFACSSSSPCEIQSVFLNLWQVGQHEANC